MLGKPVTGEVRIRNATPDDGKAILTLVRALAEYEKLEPPDAAAEQRLIQHAFGEKPRFEIFLAEWLEQSGAEPLVVGYAFAFETYSTFMALPTLYLEDLFVLPEYRGMRAGLALFRHVVRQADLRGCGRVDFAVLDWNQLARSFYNRLGAEHLENWCCYRLARERFSYVMALPDEELQQR